ncbi:MAG: serine--tRNA ligase, partial [Proteobacteria bacterium]|nr:serine--tRNA ligase [Pseudomonadota bacterium]
MLDLKDVAKNFDQVLARLKTRGSALELGPFQDWVAQRRDLIQASEALAAQRNQINEEIKAKAQNDPSAVEAIRGRMKELSAQLKDKETHLKEVEDLLQKALYDIPNVPHESVPVGASADDNVVV